MADPDRAQTILEELHAGGLRIAIDDFGTGYSSLARIRDMPVDVLKIDRSFVSGVDMDPQNQSIVSAFIELARGLGLTTLAEGIETEGELAFVQERGCVMGQGFQFSKAVPPEEIIAMSFGGVRAASGGAERRGSAPTERVRTAPTMAAASIRAHARSSSGAPDPGMSVTASLITRPRGPRRRARRARRRRGRPRSGGPRPR